MARTTRSCTLEKRSTPSRRITCFGECRECAVSFIQVSTSVCYTSQVSCDLSFVQNPQNLCNAQAQKPKLRTTCYSGVRYFICLAKESNVFADISQTATPHRPVQ